MDFTQYHKMDPHILYSIINMRMRNTQTNLEAVLYDLDIDVAAFTRHMAHHGFFYLPETNQFRSI